MPSPQPNPATVVSLRLSCVAAALAVASGSVVLAGWALTAEPLKSIVPRLVRMNPATAAASLPALLRSVRHALDQHAALCPASRRHSHAR